jgi:hypothetical protein
MAEGGVTDLSDKKELSKMETEEIPASNSELIPPSCAALETTEGEDQGLSAFLERAKW